MVEQDAIRDEFVYSALEGCPASRFHARPRPDGAEPRVISVRQFNRWSPEWKALKALHQPTMLIPMLANRLPFVPFSLRHALDAWPRPYLGYGMVEAALQARRLDMSAMIAIEFGVGRGGGLLIMEQLAGLIKAELGVSVSVVGFDLGTGLPASSDYRDCPYIWQRGHYEMDVEQLRKQLRSAKLILGDVSSTVGEFLKSSQGGPIGFVSFDLDYWSSTKAAMTVLKDRPETLLPRTFCYFDDIVGPDIELHNRFAGELLAIDEFNSESDQRKLSLINGLAAKRITPCLWAEQMYVLHAFDHPRYNDYIYPDADR